MALLHREITALALRLLQVMPRRKVLALATQNHHPHAVVGARIGKGAVQLLQQLLPLRVGAVGAIEPDAAHMAVVFNQDVL